MRVDFMMDHVLIRQRFQGGEMLKRFMITSAMLLLLSGCAGVVAVGGAVSEFVVDNFKGVETSLPITMNAAMASVQQGLIATDFSAEVIEFQQDGYLISFRNGDLEGLLALSKQTKKLTTLYVKVKSTAGVIREETVEKTLLEVISKRSKRVRSRARFNYAGYNFIRAKPSIKSKKVGRYKRGVELKLQRSPEDNAWLQIKMPSGKKAFLKGKNTVKKKS